MIVDVHSYNPGYSGHQTILPTMNNNTISADWQRCKSTIFWGEIAPCDHVVQIYENDDIFLEALAGFVGDGINVGDCVLVIATDQHLKSLEQRLKNHGIYVDALITNGLYMPLNAEETLAKFMVNGWPDEKRFNLLLSKTFEKARQGDRKVRAFGEMVAILWAQGYYEATVHLEHLWNKFCEKEPFPLFCAYPRSGFTGDIHQSIHHICGTHSKMIAGSEKQLAEVIYRDIKQKQAV